MLNEQQALTVKVAVGRATDKNAEIKKLAAGMKVSEDEIRAVLPGAVSASVPKTPSSKAQQPKVQKNKHLVWTPEMIKQLTELQEKGEKYSRISEMMGLDVKQVINKLHRKPDKRTSRPNPAPAVKSNPAPVPPSMESPESETAKTPASQKTDEPRKTIDMPRALLLMMKLVPEQIGKNVVRMYASNDENRAVCAFKVGSVEYDLTLEVVKWDC